MRAAAAAGDLDLLRLCLTVSPSTKVLGEALRGAAEAGQIEALEWLLARSVGPDTISDGGTPLHWAARAGNATSIRILRHHGANAEAHDLGRGATPREWAETAESLNDTERHAVFEALTEDVTHRPALQDVTPDWFREALSVPRKEGTTELGPKRLHWIEWGHRENQTLVLVHGFAGHAEWWSFIAPFLADSYHVTAIDLSGHGDSGWAEFYSRESWADEVLAIASEPQSTSRPILIGHSMGGTVSLAAAATHSDLLGGIVLVDTPLRPPQPPPGWSAPQEGGPQIPSPKSRNYSTIEEALARFRLIPPQPTMNPFLVEYVGRKSIRPSGDGWSWKFDPSMFARRRLTPPASYLELATCPIAVVGAEHSEIIGLTCPEYVEVLQERGAPYVEVPDCHHHLLVDQPLALVAALRALLATWPEWPRRSDRP